MIHHSDHRPAGRNPSNTNTTMNTRTYLPAALAALSSIILPALSWADNEVGYIEKFALSAEREKVLGELVPGSEDY